MERIIRNSPSSNTWVKFEDSDEVRDTTSSPCSSSFMKVRNEHKDSLSTELIQQDAAEFSSLSFKRNSFPNRSRYAAFDSLRFGLNKNSQMGWSSYLLVEGEGVQQNFCIGCDAKNINIFRFKLYFFYVNLSHLVKIGAKTEEERLKPIKVFQTSQLPLHSQLPILSAIQSLIDFQYYRNQQSHTISIFT